MTPGQHICRIIKGVPHPSLLAQSITRGIAIHCPTLPPPALAGLQTGLTAVGPNDIIPFIETGLPTLDNALDKLGPHDMEKLTDLMGHISPPCLRILMAQTSHANFKSPSFSMAAVLNGFDSNCAAEVWEPARIMSDAGQKMSEGEMGEWLKQMSIFQKAMPGLSDMYGSADMVGAECLDIISDQFRALADQTRMNGSDGGSNVHINRMC